MLKVRRSGPLEPLEPPDPLEPHRPALAGDTSCDVAIVGAGIAGCTAALSLAQRGYRVVVLEAEHVGWGASGRSGGQVLPGTAASLAQLEGLIGAADTHRVWEMSVEGVARLRELIARHQIECDWTSGHMQVALKPRQEAALRAELEQLERRYAYRSARLMPLDEVRSIIASRRYVAALYDAGAGHLNPGRYTRGLALAAERAGARIFETTRVLGHSGGAALEVRSTHGIVRCQHLLFCGNAWLGSTVPALQSRIVPVGTYAIATEPLAPERAAALVRNNAAVADCNWVLDYFRRSADHRLLFGGRISYSGLRGSAAARATRRRMLGVFPQLADARIAHAWGGYIDITLNRAPDFGRLASNVWYVQGFSGHGIVLAGSAGQLAAEAIGGTSERFDVFARIPHRAFPGGPHLRRPALVLAMLWYRLRDVLS
jgi:gamma-glutamylputrescine oxidase